VTDFNTFAVATDGWYEGAESPIEYADTAVFGWLNYEATDEIVPPTVGGERYAKTEIYHYRHRRK